MQPVTPSLTRVPIYKPAADTLSKRKQETSELARKKITSSFLPIPYNLSNLLEDLHLDPDSRFSIIPRDIINLFLTPYTQSSVIQKYGENVYGVERTLRQNIKTPVLHFIGGPLSPNRIVTPSSFGILANGKIAVLDAFKRSHILLFSPQGDFENKLMIDAEIIAIDGSDILAYSKGSTHRYQEDGKHITCEHNAFPDILNQYCQKHPTESLFFSLIKNQQLQVTGSSNKVVCSDKYPFGTIYNSAKKEIRAFCMDTYGNLLYAYDDGYLKLTTSNGTPLRNIFLNTSSRLKALQVKVDAVGKIYYLTDKGLYIFI